MAEPGDENVSLDALQLALYAISLQHDSVAYDGTSFSVSSSTPTEVGARCCSATTIVVAGMCAITALVHNNEANKAEAIRRGALQAIHEALVSKDYALEPAVFYSSAKLSKAVTFKNAVGRQVACDIGLVTALLTGLDLCLDLLEYSSRGGAAGAASAPGMRTADTCGALAATEELLVCIASLVNGHGGCLEQAVEAGAIDSVKRAMAVLQVLSGPGKWPQQPAPSPAAEKELVLPAASLLDVAKKANFLLVLLQP